ncbi:hypothetical protein CLU79DRAFT_716190 [Phycomyces nitens]|nr:hypothetical protein CLU79DRAFT_716190 [Phycomyces nitens]
MHETRMKHKAETPKIEADSLLFDGVSVGTTIKRHGEALVGRYKELNNKQKHVAGLCLNTMKNADLDKAYQSARNSESAALNSDKEHIFNIYAHIINIYRHRRSSLNNNIKNNTELDGLVKLWTEVFEALFPDSQDNVKCRWGESKAHHKDYKIYCRVIAIINTQKVDVMDVEAARYLQNQKTNNDHLKLAIESKGILDHIVRHAASFDPKTDMVLMLQVCQNQCDVKVLSLCDRGLYCLWKETSLSLPSSPKLFAKDADSWFATLELIRTSTIKLSQQLNRTDDRSYDSHFNRKGKSKAIDYKDWLRGTFFPPDTDKWCRWCIDYSSSGTNLR